MTSAARLDLNTRLDEVRVLAAQDPSRRSSDPFGRPLSSALNRACLILLSAHLEGFLEDLAVEALDALVAANTPVHRLPLMLRAAHAEEHLARLDPIKDRNARAPRIQTLFENEMALWVGGNTLSPEMVRAKTVCGSMDNPGSTQVRHFLEMLGVDIRAHLQERGRTSTLSLVDTLVGRRNAIAHGDSSATVTGKDTDDYLAAVGELADEIDDAVSGSVLACSGGNTRPW